MTFVWRVAFGCLLVWLAFACSLVAGESQAATVQVEVSADQVEVGQQVRVRAVGSSDQEQLDNPRLQVPKGFVVNGPSVGTQQQISIINGRMERTIGTTATWIITPTKVGTFQLGPATFNEGGRSVRGNTVTVQVVAEGTLPKRRRSGFPLDDDLMPGLGGGSLFDDLFRPPPRQQAPPAPPEYQVSRAEDPEAFLHATVTPARAVVGEQVTLRVYAYGALGLFAEGTSTEARHPQFFAVPIIGNSLKQRPYQVEIGERSYLAIKVREIALFPLEAGTLKIGPMTMSFYGRGYATARDPEGTPRSTKELEVVVTDAPSVGQPPGYQPGDVGSFRLTADVSPRTVEAGGSVAVVATLEGTGKLPGALVTPEQKGTDWLEPTLTEKMSVNRDGEVQGTRTFTYLVRLNHPGEVQLGDLTLPYYQPKLRRYATARAKLGTVQVTGSAPVASADAQGSDSDKRLSDELSPMTALRGQTSDSEFLTDPIWFFPSLLLAPSLVLVMRGGSALVANVRRRRTQQRQSGEELTRAALAEASKELAKGNASGALLALERALFFALERATSVKGRGVLLSRLRDELKDAGLSEELAARGFELVGRCQDARFSTVDADAKQLLAEVKSYTRTVLRHGPRTVRTRT